jgi:hypothetical protein
MKNLDVNGLYTHDLMRVVLEAKYPKLVYGVDYAVAHMLDTRGKQMGPPFISKWTASEARPKDGDIAKEFRANQAKYRAIFARRLRDLMLQNTDAYMGASDIPGDKGPMKAYRQKLRDIPQQPGFPMNINWPELK